MARRRSTSLSLFTPPRRQRHTGPTKEELRKQEKQRFLDNSRSHFERLVTEYFLAQGHLVLPEDAARADPALAGPIMPLIEGVNYVQRLVRDGGPLTAHRKEQLLEAGYAMERLVAQITNPHPLLAKYDRFTNARSTSYIIITAAIVCGIAAIFFPPVWIGAGLGLVLGIALALRANRMKPDIINSAITVVSKI